MDLKEIVQCMVGPMPGRHAETCSTSETRRRAIYNKTLLDSQEQTLQSQTETVIRPPPLDRQGAAECHSERTADTALPPHITSIIQERTRTGTRLLSPPDRQTGNKVIQVE